MLTFHWYAFHELPNKRLYEVLQLRATVFVVDQACAYLDPDGDDLLTMHLLALDESGLAGYLRLYTPLEGHQKVRFGRVVTAPSQRKKGIGKKMMAELLSYCQQHYPNDAITCSAQSYLLKFYESFGFHAVGEDYDLDGIPHISMVKPAVTDRK